MRIYISCLLWIFPVIIMFLKQDDTLNAIFIATALTIIINIDRFRSFRFGELEAVLIEVNEKAATIAQLSNAIFEERVKTICSEKFSTTIVSIQRYESPEELLEYFEVMNLKSKLKIELLAPEILKMITDLRNRTINGILNSLTLSIEMSYCYDSSDLVSEVNPPAKDYDELLPQLEPIFNFFKETDILDDQTNDKIYKAIRKKYKPNHFYDIDWDKAMFDLNRVKKFQ